MRNLILLIMVAFSFSTGNAQVSIYDIEINNIGESPIDLTAFKGKNILFVNVPKVRFYTTI